jgi:hypothetical protein
MAFSSPLTISSLITLLYLLCSDIVHLHTLQGYACNPDVHPGIIDEIPGAGLVAAFFGRNLEQLGDVRNDLAWLEFLGFQTTVDMAVIIDPDGGAVDRMADINTGFGLARNSMPAEDCRP